ncbi:NFYB/HAP3 family transcription factor subunit [Candidatus Woesearchaeota archaeon]|nr:NFYB/HAP3 family transcription factor subunit [Candidatus Woesearchaeota archaeon]
MSDKLLPLAAMEKIIKKVGGSNIRVSDKAKSALKSVIEERAEEIAEKAWRLATHAGRKTVKEGDIRLAVKQ